MAEGLFTYYAENGVKRAELQFQKGNKEGSGVFYHPNEKNPVIVPVHGNRDLAKGTFFSILKDAGIEKEEI